MGSSGAIILLLLSTLIFDTIPCNKAMRHAVSDYTITPTSQTSKHWYRRVCFPFFTSHCTRQDKEKPTPQLPSPLQSPSPQPELPTTPPASAPSHLQFQDQRLAVIYPVIQKFKSTISSDPLGITTTWVGSDICSYKGFYCDIPPDNASATVVAAVDFNGYQLTAPTLDGFLDKLPDIALFHANSNNFGGSISPNIASLQYLSELDISNNKLSGPFPMAALGMEDLTFLDLRFNALYGSVPPAIYTQNLNVLFLNDNDFVSPLPDHLNGTRILYLALANNKFKGPIPLNISTALSALTEVLLLNNQLTGCLPYELGLLTQVTLFDISNNLLTGPLPFSLSCLERVEVLNFAGNLLSGMVPDSICRLPYLARLLLSDNYFNNVGPLCMSMIQRGMLDIRNNCIIGLPVQRPVIDCAKFFSMPRICPHMETYRIIPCKPSLYPAKTP